MVKYKRTTTSIFQCNMELQNITKHNGAKGQNWSILDSYAITFRQY